jgi:hypothetical protein
MIIPSANEQKIAIIGVVIVDNEKDAPPPLNVCLATVDANTNIIRAMASSIPTTARIVEVSGPWLLY